METAFDSHWKRLESWVGTKCLAFCNYYKREVFFRNIHKRYLTCRDNCTLQARHPRSSWYNFNMTALSSNRHPLSSNW